MSSIRYQVGVDEAQLQEAVDLFEYVGGNSNDALRVAINKTGPKVRTKSSQRIRQQIRLKARYVNERLKFQRATRLKLGGSIVTPSRGLLLSRFSTDAQVANENIGWIAPPDQPARGVRVRVKPQGPTRTVGGDGETTGRPFYLVLRNSRQIGIAARRRVAGPRGGKLKVFHGPSLSQVFNDVRDDVLPEAQAELTSQLMDAMRFLLAKRFIPEA